MQRPGESAPGLVFSVDAPVSGALTLVRGGSMVAVGDDNGTVAIYSTETGEEWFKAAKVHVDGCARCVGSPCHQKVHGLLPSPKMVICASGTSPPASVPVSGVDSPVHRSSSVPGAGAALHGQQGAARIMDLMRISRTHGAAGGTGAARPLQSTAR